MKKIAAMTAIVALISMPVLAAGTGRVHWPFFNDAGRRLHRAERRGDDRGECEIAAR